MELSKFKHKYTVRVRFNEVDMLGVCNNAVYINYFEDARLKYIQQAGLMPESGIFTDGRLYFIVKNEINYKSHAHYDDVLNIYTRMAFIKNSSFGFEHMVLNEKTNEIVALGSGVLAHVDPATMKSAPVEPQFIDKVKMFDPEVEIIR